MSEKWLKSFFDVVDHNRLDRGKKLYLDGCLSAMNKENNGFRAVVKGSGSKEYELHAAFQRDEEGLPLIETLSIECECPDWVEYCKHAVCAMISYFEGKQMKTWIHREEKTDVEKLLNRDMEQLMDLGPLPVMGKSRSFDEMQLIVQKKLRDLKK